jgi:hypothetical protein
MVMLVRYAVANTANSQLPSPISQLPTHLRFILALTILISS